MKNALQFLKSMQPFFQLEATHITSVTNTKKLTERNYQEKIIMKYELLIYNKSNNLFSIALFMFLAKYLIVLS